MVLKVKKVFGAEIHSVAHYTTFKEGVFGQFSGSAMHFWIFLLPKMQMHAP
jgi:hypothetical protein